MDEIIIGSFDMTDLAPSFDNLPVDQYTEGGFRLRRLSKVKVKWDKKVCEYTNTPGSIMQPSEINGFLGDIERTYEAIESDVFFTPCFLDMMKTFQKVTKWKKDFNIHQIRIQALPHYQPTFPAPEGIHRDGYVWTVPFVLGGTNVTGGDFIIYDDDKKEIVRGNLKNRYAVFDDKTCYHYADPIVSSNPFEKGYWDIFVFTAR